MLLERFKAALGQVHTAALEPVLRLVGRNSWEGIGKACSLCEKF